MNNAVKKAVIFIILLFIQIFWIDQIDLGSFNYYFSPIIYGLVLLTIHPGTKTSNLLIIGFIMGLSVDLFRNTIGLNISALVAVAYFRNTILSLISPRDGFDPIKDITIISVGLTRYLMYASIMLFIHHFWFYIIEDYHFNQLLFILFRSFINTFFALGIIVLFQYLTLRRN